MDRTCSSLLTMLHCAIFSVALFVIQGSLALAPTKEELYCGACRMLLDEIEHNVRTADPNKVIEVGSFRVDPKGNQKLSEVPYARSETHIHELLEKACDKARLYGYGSHPTTKRLTFIRMEEFDKRKRKLNVEKSDLIKSKLMFACENVLEDHEEKLLKLLTREHESPTQHFCSEVTDYCKKEDFVEFPFEIEEAPVIDNASDDSESKDEL